MKLVKLMNDPVTGYPAAGALPQNTDGYGGAAYQQPPRDTAYPCEAPPPASAVYNQPNIHDPIRKAPMLQVLGVYAIAVIGISIIYIFVYILDDREPVFRVDSLSVSNLNLTNSLISGKWDLRFIVKNPTKEMAIFYNDIAAAVFYDDASLSDTTVPPLFQVDTTQTARQVSFATAGAYMDNQAFDKMNKERSQKGAIGFNVRIVAGFRVSSGVYWNRMRTFVMVYCKDLSVGVGSNNSSGTLLGGARQCQVEL
ncbi:NDR1/HIN1-like protein 2 isoform X2 [Solanum lycopersicum]|uniref:NDR1/HIN1-like protein 2 isoform X2 n=1 Tax=Solanum lycopersicum TaxID=4081 RepID=UPI003747F4C1